MFTGLFLGLMFTINFFLSLSHIGILGFISLITTVLVIYYTYRKVIKFRNNDCDGCMTYGKSLIYIILSFFFGALISSAVKFFYVAFINKEYLDLLLQETYKVLDAMKFGISEENYDQLEKMMTPFGFAIQSIWANLLLGLLLGVIMSFFVRKEKSTFE